MRKFGVAYAGRTLPTQVHMAEMKRLASGLLIEDTTFLPPSLQHAVRIKDTDYFRRLAKQFSKLLPSEGVDSSSTNSTSSHSRGTPKMRAAAVTQVRTSRGSAMLAVL